MGTFNEYFNNLLQNVKILSPSIVTNEVRKEVSKNPDVIVWLGKIGFSTRPHYLTSLCYFLKCVGIENPTELLDLKMHENVRRRFFPAERLVEYWQSFAHQAHIKANREKRILDSIRSYFKYNRVQLLQIKCSYKPKPKSQISDDDLCRFREVLDWRNTILFDFLLSVPLRDGQFQICQNCLRDFFPKWQHILTFPEIKHYSPFVIQPEKGHENNKYPQEFMQVCFLTETTAKGLNVYREIKERELAKKLKPEDYIFTHIKSCDSRYHSSKHITPIQQAQVQNIFLFAQRKTSIRIYPHLIRAWVNSRLASCGIDKQIRDIYLGHVSVQNQEEGYILQMLPKWRETFQKAKAVESLDLVQGIIGPMELQDKLLQMEDQRREIERLKNELSRLNMTQEEIDNLRWLLEKVKNGKVIIKE